jgi:hypothetical protein
MGPRISMRMSCPGYMQLNQHYVVALRRWEQARSSLNKPELFDVVRRLSLEVETRAVEERNAAHARMALHKQNCSVCKAKA